MILKSFSKINLSLNINGKFKKNGLHKIQSYFCLIDIFDEIKIEENKNSKAQADSNAGNFLLGVMMAMQEDWACDPYR